MSVSRGLVGWSVLGVGWPLRCPLRFQGWQPQSSPSTRHSWVCWAVNKCVCVCVWGGSGMPQEGPWRGSQPEAAAQHRSHQLGCQCGLTHGHRGGSRWSSHHSHSRFVCVCVRRWREDVYWAVSVSVSVREPGYLSPVF